MCMDPRFEDASFKMRKMRSGITSSVMLYLSCAGLTFFMFGSFLAGIIGLILFAR